MMNALTTAFLASLAIILSATTQAATSTVKFERNNHTEIYIATNETGSLEIKWRGKSKTIPAALGSSGESYRAFVNFNKGPALLYENQASSTSFQVYYTLKIKNDIPIVDCIYSNIRNAQNGTSIRKAVCNLVKPLTSDYQELIFPYSDKWIGESNTINIEQLMTEPPQPVDVPVGSLDGIDIVLRYDSLDDLISASPRTLVMQGTELRDLGTGNAFFVYDTDGRTPLGLDVERNQETHLLERLHGTKLLEAK